MRVIAGRIGDVATIGVCVIAALALSIVVRQVTAGLNQTLGTVWPFSTVHCEQPSTPGCSGQPRTLAPQTWARR